MRVLVVDDELVSRKKMEKIMASLGNCQVAESGNDALKVFEKSWMNWSPLDLITLDISMPDMDGTEVLYNIRKKEKNVPKEKRVKVIMVTSHKDKGSIITSVQAGCDDYITKPFDKETIVAKLEKMGVKYFRSNKDTPAEMKEAAENKKMEVKAPPVLDKKPNEEDNRQFESKESIVKEISDRFQRKEVDLPAYSKIALKFREMVDDGAGFQEVSDLLKQDAAFTSKLISVSNSAYYRGVEENKDLEQAVNRLGLQTTSQYVDVICNRALYFSQLSKKYPELIEKLWSHSLACAYASQAIADVQNLKLPEDPFMMGLLHDIGKLLIIQILSELERKKKLGDKVTEKEYSETLNQLHVPFGCALLKRWGFPDDYIQVVNYHHNLEDAEPITKGLLVVHFSNLLVKSLGFDLSQNGEIDLNKAESAGLLKLDEAKINDIKQKVEGYILGLKEILA